MADPPDRGSAGGERAEVGMKQVVGMVYVGPAEITERRRREDGTQVAVLVALAHGMVEVQIDVERLASILGRRALLNKGQRAVGYHGAIEARVAYRWTSRL